MSVTAPDLRGFAVSGYKAYAREARVDLGRITVLLGRNNAGKSALAFAPVFLAQALRPDARTPFDLVAAGLDFGANLLDVCHQRRLSGLRGRLLLDDAGGVEEVGLGATAEPEQAYRQVLTEFVLRVSGEDRAEALDWEAVRSQLAQYPALAQLPASLTVLRADRLPMERSIRMSGAAEPALGPRGDGAFEMLAQAGAGARPDLLPAVNDWLKKLDLAVDVVSERAGSFSERAGSFEVRVTRPGIGGSGVHLLDTGSGVAQVLPLVVALSGHSDVAARDLLIVEQPELHLHPRAHAAVAELFVAATGRAPRRRFLVETHSDAFVLRLRREVAAGRLGPADVRLYFVDEGDGRGGSGVREIPLNERGTPGWWPKGVFAEPQAEYHAIRRELARRDDATEP